MYTAAHPPRYVEMATPRPIPVTQEHIDTGVRDDCFGCALSLAIRDVYESFAAIEPEDCGVDGFMGGLVIVEFAELDDATVSFELPDEAKRFMADWEANNAVEPFTFTPDHVSLSI